MDKSFGGQNFRHQNKFSSIMDLSQINENNLYFHQDRWRKANTSWNHAYEIFGFGDAWTLYTVANETFVFSNANGLMTFSDSLCVYKLVTFQSSSRRAILTFWIRLSLTLAFDGKRWWLTCSVGLLFPQTTQHLSTGFPSLLRLFHVFEMFQLTVRN